MKLAATLKRHQHTRGARTDARPGLTSCEVQDNSDRRLHARLAQFRVGSPVADIDFPEAEQLSSGFYRLRQTLSLAPTPVQTPVQMPVQMPAQTPGHSPPGLRTASLPYWPEGLNNIEQCVFIDTETNGLGTASGTIAFMIGLLRIRQSGAELEQLFITDFAAESAMLNYLVKNLPEDAVLVSYNGKQFDIPLLQGRLRLMRLAHELGQYPHFDLLYPVRLAFQKIWPDCRLQTAERYLLNKRRVDDFPGELAPQAWMALLQRRDSSMFRQLLRHNRDDLHHLAQVLFALQAVYLQPDRYRVNRCRIARRWHREGDDVRAIGCLRSQCDSASRLLLAHLYRRRGEWHEAVAIWTARLEDGCIESHVELAKYLEHRARAPEQALVLVQDLVRLAPDAEHRRRLARLQTRCAQPCVA